MSPTSTASLWDESNGQTLTTDGWQPTTVVDAKRDQAVQLLSVGTALIVGSGLVAAALWYYESSLVNEAVVILYSIILVAYVLGGVLIATSWANGRKVRAEISDAGVLLRLGLTGVAIISTLMVLGYSVTAPSVALKPGTGPQSEAESGTTVNGLATPTPERFVAPTQSLSPPATMPGSPAVTGQPGKGVDLPAEYWARFPPERQQEHCETWRNDPDLDYELTKFWLTDSTTATDYQQFMTSACL